MAPEQPSRRGLRALRGSILPVGADPGALPLLLARGLRTFGDGCVAVLLPAWLLALGMGTLEVGLISTATMFGSALATLAVGAWGHRFARRSLLRAAALLMLATGIGFASISSFWPLLVVAFVGTLNPSSGDVSVFLPLEHATLAGAARGDARTTLFARYSVLGGLCAAVGALATGIPDWRTGHSALSRLDALRGMFVAYGAIGALFWWLYQRLPEPAGGTDPGTAAPLAHRPGLGVDSQRTFADGCADTHLAGALSPTLGGALFAAGWIAAPLIGCGLLKLACDLALWRAFRLHRPNEDRPAHRPVDGRTMSDAFFFACFAAFFSLGVMTGCFFVSLVLCLNLPMILLLECTDPCAAPVRV